MSEYDNLYLCPVCDNVDQIVNNIMTCDLCGFQDCFVAKHINDGTRKYWIRREQNLGPWRFDNQFKTMLKNSIPENNELNKNFTKAVKGIFMEFVKSKDKLEEIFPKFTRDYKRTTGRRDTGWKYKQGRKSVSQQKNSSLRGIIYEGAMNHFCGLSDDFDIVKIPIEYYDKARDIDTDYEPDFWFLYNDETIPVEFKTFEKQAMVKKNFMRGIKQSRRYGNISYLTHNNPNKYSAMIVCCPEERTFSCVVLDQKAERLL